ncbi:GcvT family protein [Aquabacterium sp.]|uniref:GcvT family protein n=1 Tax=Aquabacterium sp. TaxID=1872578 RepID=UPI002CAC8AEE|nr:FAD-dependent oxidoreductase [Aquabacterium sp.]HSW05953.1 FAD-dependent oxidoreductase [Aquabacterium sp.]
MAQLPTHSRVIIVGGGIAGCSTAYHLAKSGLSDVLLLEQGKLTSGTTWHAAGLVGQMRPNRTMTTMSRYGISLYAALEAETGLATGWKACGSVNVARTSERMQVLHKQAALARGFGVEVQVITPQEAGALYPVMRTDDLQGAIWIPGDGKANPTDLTMSLAKGARNRGATLVEDVEVIAVHTADGPSGRRVTGVQVRREGGETQEIVCEVLVNCAGQWARQFGRLAGVNVPLYSAEHFYVVTGRIDGVHPMLPVMRDPDGFIYYKEEVGGLVMGGFEPVAKPWTVEPIPSTFQFQLLDEDWDQFEVLMNNAIHRTPCLETAEIKMLLNGPESFTPDGNFILGEAPGLRHYHVCAGFNSAGIANAGGAGRLMAEWIAADQAPGDLWDVDVRRFGPFMANRRLLAERTVETLGLHYAMRWPRQELVTARPLRTSPLYDALAARGAEFGSKNGWERANYFRPKDAATPPPGLGTPGWLPWVQAEMRATREAVAVYDQTSFSKLLLQGRDALAVLQRLCAKDIDVAVDRLVYTAVLNEQGGFESDFTVMRLARDKFLIVTGSAQAVRDADWINRHMAADEHAVLTDVGALWCVLSVMGPRSRELLARLSPDDLGSIGFSHTREIDLGLARVRAVRISYVGGPGYELYVPVEVARHVDQVLHAAGRDLGLADAGYYALDALRIEAGRRAWGAELGPDDTPHEAGLWRGVTRDKPGFIGREALLAREGQPLTRKLLSFVLDDPHAWVWGGEAIVIEGDAVGELSSTGWSPKAGRCVGLGYVRGAAAQRMHAGTPVLVDLWGQLRRATAWDDSVLNIPVNA